MSSKEFQINGTDYKLVLTDHMIGQIKNLKNLYSTAYEDPESFEEVSAEISNTINEVASAIEPSVRDSDLDGLIQAIIRVVDSKTEALEKEMQDNEKQSQRKSK